MASHGKFVEKPEDYGALFQWGRKGDGHEQRTCLLHSGTVSSGFDSNGQILSGQPAYGKFINASSSPFDWRSPKIDNLWDSGTESSPVKTANDPCPTGWRVPTKDELKSLIDSGSECKPDFNGESGRLFGSGANNIFLPAAGARSGYDGQIKSVGYFGNYWSSTPDSYYAYLLDFCSGYFEMSCCSYRDAGRSVRCVAE